MLPRARICAFIQIAFPTVRAQREIGADVQISGGVLILIRSGKCCSTPVDMLDGLFVSLHLDESNHVILSFVSPRT